MNWIEDPYLDAPEGHTWMRPAPEDCPHCPCHTARVCDSLLWHLSRPENPDGTPYTEPCPCRTREESRPHNVSVTVGGTTYVVGADLFRGTLVTDAVWDGVATDPDTGQPAPVPLALVLANAEYVGSDLDNQPRVADPLGREVEWVQIPGTVYNGVHYKITGPHS